MAKIADNKKKKNIVGIIQSGLILVLVVLVIFIMIQIGNLQGTARVINYAGLVRGATQREIKLEITGTQNDGLIRYLDDIMSGLKYQDGHYLMRMIIAQCRYYLIVLIIVCMKISSSIIYMAKVNLQKDLL